MNYALDALWWRLTHPTIRALATLLTAPLLWRSEIELPVCRLLGKHGFRFLLQLNDEPNRLPEKLLQPQNSHLGHYAEDLLAFWFTHAPHSTLIAHNLPIVSGSQTLGALDFVVALSGSLHHVELTCKYYGSSTGQPENMVGLNPRDTLLAKQHKMQQQSQLSQHPVAKTILTNMGIEAEKLQCANITRGMAFTLSGSLPEHTLYPLNAWTGLYFQHQQQWQQFAKDARFYPLQRHEYLAPARITYDQTHTRDAITQMGQGLYAQVMLRPDGFWHEQQRIMFMHRLPEKGNVLQ
ncbi:MAG: DUF1853 family protein [Alysiella sp.]|uniref:DUF1853 family protein n=1 Tax=Alysiella sp. TaxID=1872483 RepID=UPI0026DD3921|nr:DUF1853 family protein [Alysiella sp.]MDO4433056.1 DUF1853 family protein [Alysiella sp.]